MAARGTKRGLAICFWLPPPLKIRHPYRGRGQNQTTRRPQMLVLVSICRGKPFGVPIFDPYLSPHAFFVFCFSPSRLSVSAKRLTHSDPEGSNRALEFECATQAGNFNKSASIILSLLWLEAAMALRCSDCWVFGTQADWKQIMKVTPKAFSPLG